jgi:hypothetical protein
MAPATMKQWVVKDKEHDLDGLVYEEARVPKVGENEVLVKIKATSLNYRDLIIPKVGNRYHVFISSMKNQLEKQSTHGLIGHISICSQFPSRSWFGCFW